MFSLDVSDITMIRTITIYYVMFQPLVPMTGGFPFRVPFQAMPNLFRELSAVCRQLEDHYKEGVSCSPWNVRFLKNP